MRCQFLHFFEFDLFHAAHAMPHVEGVNSVSLQPLFVLTAEFGRVRHLAQADLSCDFGLLKPFRVPAVYELIVLMA
jgi:hypothetical protein